MATLAEQAISILQEVGVELQPGLSTSEIEAVEEKYGFKFGDDHKALLTLALPIGSRWVDWRKGDEKDIRQLLRAPVDGVVRHVFTDSYWAKSWGMRPADDVSVEEIARSRLAQWPVLVPVWGHRYLPADPAPMGSPVFSVVETDVIHYGVNIVDYMVHEWLPRTPRDKHLKVRYRYVPWSDLRESREPDSTVAQELCP